MNDLIKKSSIFSLIAISFITQTMLGSSDKQSPGPMNPDWFYEKNDFTPANKYHQKRKWAKAEEAYALVLNEKATSEYDKSMAMLNQAACMMAQRKPSEGWKSFDQLIGIDKNKQLLSSTMQAGQTGSVLVRTDGVGIGDIFHFLSAAALLKKKTGLDVIISVRNFLKKPLSSAVTAYSLNFFDTNNPKSTTYETHLIGLLGHLNIKPTDMCPEKVLFTAADDAIEKVNKQIEPILSQNKKLLTVFLGEDRQATLIGGKQLPRNKEAHGRHLDSKPFISLLQNNSDLSIMDGGNKSSQLKIEKQDECSKQYMIIPDEITPFDMIIALGRIMSKDKNIYAIGADNGPTNVFSRALDQEAQDRMAFIIPNGQEYDMRMEGKGNKYKQMISNCWVYKCEKPTDQEKVVQQAYNDMSSNS